MRNKIVGITIGIIIGSLFLASMGYAASKATSINVYLKNIKYMFDGVQKVPSTGSGFIYEGTTYVPLRFVSEALGKDVSWDGSTETIWIGKKDGEFKYLSDIDYARMDGEAKENLYFNEWKYPSGLKFHIASIEYLHGIGAVLDSYNWKNGDNRGSIDYNLNGQYQKITGFVGIDDYTKNSDNIGTVIINGDGKEIYRISDLKGGNNPISFDINVKGVLKLQIQFETNDNKGQLDIVLGDLKIY